MKPNSFIFTFHFFILSFNDRFGIMIYLSISRPLNNKGKINNHTSMQEIINNEFVYVMLYH